MATDWTIGKGLLSNGFPDSDWTHMVTMRATPTDAGWRVWIRWGTTWGHMAVSEAPTFDQALEQAGRNAKRDDCPDEWNPRLPN